MKRDLRKIIPLFVVLLVFGMAFITKTPRDLNSYVNRIAAQNKLALGCDGSGEGRLYYVTASALNVRKGPSTNYTSLGTIQHCTQVRVYCTTGSWARISKLEDRFVHTSYISTNRPKGCSNNVTTKRTPVTFNNVSVSTTNASGYDKLYANKSGSINVTVSGISGAASDDVGQFHYSVEFNGNNVTNAFTKQGGNSISGGRWSFTLKMNPNYTPGRYTIKVWSTDTGVKTATFDIVNNYYNFTLGEPKLTSWFPSAPPNITNSWDLPVNKTDIDNNNGFTVKITKGGKDFSSSFTWWWNWNSITIQNNSFGKNRPKSGVYTIEVSYYANDTVGTITRTKTITLGSRKLDFEQYARESHRYIRNKITKPYSIQVLSRTASTIKFYEDGVLNTLSIDAFKKIYADFDLTPVYTTTDGKIAYRYNETCTVINMTATDVTYIDGLGATIVSPIAEFQTAFAAAYKVLTDGTYSMEANGDLKYNRSGLKTVETKQLSPLDRVLFSISGGEIVYTFKYKTKDIDPEDFRDSTIEIWKSIEGADSVLMTETDGFSTEWLSYDEKLDKDYSLAKLKVVYDNTSDYYTGIYDMSILFPDAGGENISIELFDGEIDFYLTSQLDKHITESEPLTQEFPPGNQKYEYYLGLFIVKSGTVMNKRNPNADLNVRIFDHQVNLDADGNEYYFDQIDYEVRIEKYLSGNVTYRLVTDAGVSDPITESRAVFKSKYAEAEAMLEHYNYNASGAITSDKALRHVKSYKKDATGNDMIVEFVEEGSTTVQTLPLDTFKVKYPEEYGYIITRYSFTADGNIILGALRGSYEKTTDDDGNPIIGHELTDLFNIERSEDPTEIEKALIVTPKTEVDAGTYYVYANYESLKGVGYINKEPVDPLDTDWPVITKEQYPEMWYRNIHMTSIRYDVPKYKIDVKSVELSNVGNSKEQIYNNIEGTAKFNISSENIYNFEGFSYKIQKYNGTSWVDASSMFNVVNSMEEGSLDYDITNPYISLTSIVGSATSGKYRVVMDYTNKGEKAEQVAKEFEIGGKYYGLVLEQNQVIKFVHNYNMTQNVFAKGLYVQNPDSIVPSIKRYISSGNYETYTLEGRNFKDSSGKVAFTYDYLFDKNYYPGEDALYYHFMLTNIGGVPPVGEYTLTFSYKEGSNETTTTEIDFLIADDVYNFNISNVKARATDDEMSLTFDIRSEYISYADLSKINYTIYYYDTALRQYVDVSSVTSDRRMFVITKNWNPDTGTYNQTGKLNALMLNTVDMDGDYYIEAKYLDETTEYSIPTLKELFNWSIVGAKVGGTYTDTIIDENGDTITNEIQLNRFYRNVPSSKLELTISSVHENNIQWVINKECLEEECDPTAGINFNDRFTVDNRTGTDKKISFMLAEGKDITPGLYAVTLFYSSTDYQTYQFLVDDDYVAIEVYDFTEHSVVNDKLVDGLYRNKVGYASIPVAVRGVDYGDVSIKVTDPLGKTDYSSYLTYNSKDFIDTHTLKINYSPTSNLSPGDYLVTISYPTSTGIVSAEVTLTMNEEYFDFTLEEPLYTPDPMYANVPNGGTITYRVDTVDIPYLLTGENGLDATANKHKFVENLSVTNADNVDVTDLFTVKTSLVPTEPYSFNMNLTFAKNALEPGYYKAKTFFKRGTTTLVRESTFVIGDYVKDFTITSVEEISKTNDSKVHNNVGGTYRFYYNSSFDLVPEYLTLSVTSEDGIKIPSNAFKIDLTARYIDVIYTPGDVLLNSGKYNLEFTYDENIGYIPFVNKQRVNLYGTYKDIILSNMESSSTIIYADRDNQYYTFDVDVAALQDNELGMLKARVFNEEDVMVYSDVPGDSTDNSFDIVNNLGTADKNFRINIVPFKAQIGEYTIRLYLPDEDGNYYSSNALTFDITNRYYRINLSGETNFTQKVTYKNDKTSIYDRDGANAYYKFTSNFGLADKSVYTIKVMQGSTVVKEIKNLTLNEVEEDGIKYLDTTFDVTGIDAGTYDVAVCLNGLPYISKELVLKEFIPVSDMYVYIDGKLVDTTANIVPGTDANITVLFEPSNATNPVFTYSIDNTDIATIDGNTISVLKEGIANLTIKNDDITKKIVIDGKLSLTSDIYKIDYENNYIYIDSMNVNNLAKDTFLTHLFGLASDFKILNKKGNDVTSTVSTVGTGMSVVTNGNTYKVILIGDLNGDGKINVGDVGYLYQYVQGVVKITDPVVLKAADVRKINNITVSDVAKLYQFVQNKISKL